MTTKLFSSGYTNNTEVTLPGGLQATVNSASISSICLCDGDPVRFCALELDIGSLYYMCESEVMDDCARVSHRLKIPTSVDQLSMEDGLEDLNIVDSSHHNSVITRIVNAKNRVKFSLTLPPYCKAYYYKSYKLARRSMPCVMVCASKGAPTVNSSFLNKDTRMLIVMVGAVTYDKSEQAFYVNEGYSGLAFVAAEPSSFASMGEKAYYYLWTRDEKYLQTEQYSAAFLNCRLSDGAVFSRGSDMRIFMEDLPDAVRAFTLSGDIVRAKKAILAVKKLSNDGTRFYPCYPWVDEISNSVSAAYFIYAVKQYHELSGDNRFVFRLYPILKNAMMTVTEGIKDNMLPEISTSPLYELEMLSESTRYHGSAVSTAICIEALTWLCTYFKKTAHRLEKKTVNLKGIVEDMINAFERNFIYKDRLYHTSPKRESMMRRTRFSYGRCRGCVDHGPLIYEGLLERTNRGAYLCPSCYSEYSNDYLYERGKRTRTVTALVQVARSPILREHIGEERLLIMLWQSFEAYKKELPIRTVKEDAYMLELAVTLNKEIQADSVYKVIEKSADKLGRYTKFCDQNGVVGDDFHSGSCAAVYCALEKYKQYKKDLTDNR